MSGNILRGCAVLAAIALWPMAALANDEAELSDLVLLELNAAKTGDNTCTLSFLAINAHGKPIEKAVYETVLFDSDGQVDRLTLFNFGTLPPGRPRVRQFVVPGTTCEGLGQVLFNGANACEAAELDAGACEKNLKLETRTNIKVLG